jgi:hypothetical protein
MSYARWSNSSWYAFYNVNGKLSLWYDMDHTIDITFEDCADIDVDQLMAVYGCTREEAEEAMTYIGYFREDYDPKDGEEYDKEVAEMLKKWEDADGQEKDAVEN